MPRYFFHTRDEREIRDAEGVLLTGPEEARLEAIGAAGEMLRDKGLKEWRGPDWMMWVTDEAGATLCTLRFTVQDGDGGAAPDGPAAR